MLANYVTLKSAEQSGVIERTVRFKVITPVFGGGVSNASADTKRHLKEPDRITPIRGAAIRGQLRFWWRVLRNEADPQKLWEEEKRIWGMASEPGAVSIKISQLIPLSAGKASDQWEPVPVFCCKFNHKSQRWTVSPLPAMKEIAYAAFPLQPPKEVLNCAEEPQQGVLHRLQREVVLVLKFPAQLKDQIDQTLTAWQILGGVGGRTRRGFGAVVSDDLRVDPIQWLKEKGFLFTHSQPTEPDPQAALRFGLGKLQRFRQESQVGRNNGSDADQRGKPGRSRWPEPECIRLLTRKSDHRHSTRLVNVDKFPRAAFGMPIIFHFQSKDDPKDCHLKPVGRERLASPLIIRPYRALDGKYGCLAALLPNRELHQVQLELVGDGRTWPVDPKLTVAEAQSLKSPLRGEADPLLAFLNFFQRSQTTEKIP